MLKLQQRIVDVLEGIYETELEAYEGNGGSAPHSLHGVWDRCWRTDAQLAVAVGVGETPRLTRALRQLCLDGRIERRRSGVYSIKAPRRMARYLAKYRRHRADRQAEASRLASALTALAIERANGDAEKVWIHTRQDGTLEVSFEAARALLGELAGGTDHDVNR